MVKKRNEEDIEIIKLCLSLSYDITSLSYFVIIYAKVRLSYSQSFKHHKPRNITV